MAITKKAIRDYTTAINSKAQDKVLASFKTKVKEYADRLFSDCFKSVDAANRKLDAGFEAIRDLYSDDEFRKFFGGYNYQINRFLGESSFDIKKIILERFYERAKECLLFGNGNLVVHFIDNPGIHDELAEIVEQEVKEYHALVGLKYKVGGIIDSASTGKKAMEILEEAGLDLSQIKVVEKAKVNLPALVDLGDSIMLLNKEVKTVK